MNARLSGSSSRLELRRDFALGLWRLADPKISLASFASMFLGACAALATAFIDWSWLCLTVFGIFAIEIAKNASGEVFDYDSGVDLAVSTEDRTPFSGGKRVIVDGLLSREETIGIAAVCYALGIAIGLVIAVLRAPAILWIGVVGVTLAYQYHAPPLKLSYRGLGELAVGLCYGPLIAIGTYLVQAPHISTATVLATLPLGLLISAFLWINEFPDFAADQSAGKKTLVVRLGRTRAAWCFPGLHLLAFTGIALLPALGLSRWVLLGESGLIAALPAIAGILRQPTESAAYIPIQKWSLLTFLLTAAGQGVGFVVSSGGT